MCRLLADGRPAARRSGDSCAPGESPRSSCRSRRRAPAPRASASPEAARRRAMVRDLSPNPSSGQRPRRVCSLLRQSRSLDDHEASRHPGRGRSVQIAGEVCAQPAPISYLAHLPRAAPRSVAEAIWPGPAMKLVGPLAARSPGLRLALPLEIERHCSADEILQGFLIDLVAFVDVDGAPDIPIEAGVEETRRVLQRSSLGKRQLDDVLVRLSRADEAAVGPDGSPHPLPLFDDLRVCLVYDCAHFRERLPAPVPKFLDLLID